MRRALTVVAATMFAVGGLAGPAAGAVAPLPICEPGDGYVPGETCESAVQVVAECPAGETLVEYVVRGGAVDGSGTVDITWTGLPGGDQVVAGQPLTGELAWPSADVESAVLVFATTPPVSVPVTYACEDDSVRPVTDTDQGVAAPDDDSGVLAETGSEALPLALGGGALVLGGAAAVMMARRNRGVGAAQ